MLNRVTFKNGNVVDALLNGEVDTIAHVCNDKGVMGSGVAKYIKERIPKAYESYSMCFEDGKLEPGIYISYSGNVYNLIAQRGFGQNKRHLHYGDFVMAIVEMAECCHIDETVGMPRGMGSVRAGGDQEIIEEIVASLAHEYGFNVIWYTL